MAIFYRVEGSLAGISAFGSLLILITFLAFRETRRHPYTLVFWLSVCDFLFSIKYVVTALIPESEKIQQDYDGCLTQAVAVRSPAWLISRNNHLFIPKPKERRLTFKFLGTFPGLQSQFLGVASVGWNGVMSLYIMMTTINPFVDTRSKEKWFHLWVWSVAIITTVVMAVKKLYGPSIDGTCWMPKDQKEFDYVFMIPLLFNMFLGLLSLIISICRVNALAQARRYKMKIIFRLMFYIIVFLGCWSGLTVHEFYMLSSTTDPVWLERMRWWASLGISLSGLANSIVWLTNPTIWSAFKKRLVKNICGCIFPSLENIPLLPGLETALLQDSDMDMTRITEVLRKNVLTCILLGMRTSLRHLHSNRGRQQGGAHSSVNMSDDEFRQAGSSWDSFESLMKRRQMKVNMYESDLETDHDSDLDDAVILEDSSSESELAEPVIGDRAVRVTVEDDLSADSSSIPTADLSNSILSNDNESPRDNSLEEASESTNDRHPRQQTPSSSTLPHRRPVRKGRADRFLIPLVENDFKQIEILKLIPAQLEKATGDAGELTRSLGLFASAFIFRTMSPRVFYNLRVLAGITEKRYYDALNPVTFLANAAETVKTSEGRSGSFFCFSPDRRFILKTIPEAEFNQLMRSLRYYYNHIEYHRQSILMRILGAHSIKMSNSSSLYVIVMENMFSNSDTPIHEIYDLKGSWVDRGESDSDSSDSEKSSAKKVLFLPIQLVAGGLKQIGSALSGGASPGGGRGIRIKKDREVGRTFRIGALRADPLMEQMVSDASLLSALNIMDYSLLVGVHHKTDPNLVPLSSPADSDRPPPRPTNGSSSSGDSLEEPIIRTESLVENSSAPVSSSNISRSSSIRPPRRLDVVETESDVFYFGIIDILQPYNADKKMERCAKIYLRCKDGDGISSAEPRYYARRFIDSIQRLVK